MKRRLVAAAIGVLFLGALSSTAFAMAASGDDDEKANHGQSQKHQATKHHGKAGQDHGHAPSWARDHGHGKPDQAWKDAWKQLTPAQRAARMAELAQDHADGMKKWADCVQAAGDDASARDKCVRPLPPGLAKKRAR